jgi:hypothetical protein
MAEQKLFTSILRVVNNYNYYNDDNDNGGEVLCLHLSVGHPFRKIIKTYRDETDGCDDDVLGFFM